ncbi:MAG: response regulator transcription factor [Gammaproteobacteria bacterium]|jgi:two-component system response regulator AlgR|nr:response regulator transcription factor [Gammaproteobacteria bacterium]
MRILIVDDESLARDRIKRILQEQKEHEVIGEAGNGQEALQKIDALHPEVVLLDIRMPGIDGLEVARHLVDMEEPPAVIFVTAYDDYALEAFKVNAVDYLLKPVRAERLSEALHKALKPNKLQWKSLNRTEDGAPKARTHISSRTRRGIVLVPVGDIYYFRAEHKYVTVRHKDGEVLIEDTLKELETEFGERFLRIHRNCLVAMEYVQALEKNSSGQPCIRLRGVAETLDVSRRHVANVRQMMSG